MRTTVTLDPEVEALLRTSMRKRGLSFKQASNEAIRAGLTTALRKPARRFVQKTYSLGAERHLRWENLWRWPKPWKTKRSSGNCRFAHEPAGRKSASLYTYDPLNPPPNAGPRRNPRPGLIFFRVLRARCGGPAQLRLLYRYSCLPRRALPSCPAWPCRLPASCPALFPPASGPHV
jgi:hypothetical protein